MRTSSAVASGLARCSALALRPHESPGRRAPDRARSNPRSLGDVRPHVTRARKRPGITLRCEAEGSRRARIAQPQDHRRHEHERHAQCQPAPEIPSGPSRPPRALYLLTARERRRLPLEPWATHGELVLPHEAASISFTVRLPTAPAACRPGACRRPWTSSAALRLVPEGSPPRCRGVLDDQEGRSTGSRLREPRAALRRRCRAGTIFGSWTGVPRARSAFRPAEGLRWISPVSCHPGLASGRAFRRCGGTRGCRARVTTRAGRRSRPRTPCASEAGSRDADAERCSGIGEHEPVLALVLAALISACELARTPRAAARSRDRHAPPRPGRRS